jgi:hypothetical protein
VEIFPFGSKSGNVDQGSWIFQHRPTGQVVGVPVATGDSLYTSCVLVGVDSVRHHLENKYS